MRRPVVSSTFYEGGKTALAAQVAELLSALPCSTPRSAIGAIIPHAGYAFSGRVAGSVYARLEVPNTVVILAPNHTGIGHPAAVGMNGPWSVPTGSVPVDRALAEALLVACPDLACDNTAHAEDHAIEVHLPFLLARNPSVRMVPVCLRVAPFGQCLKFAQALAAVVSAWPEPVLIVASSDMNHHEPQNVAMRKDRMALDRVLGLDAHGLFTVVVEHHVSMCGFVPAVVLIQAARAMGATRANLVAYATSADVTGDPSSVVGYAGVILDRGPGPG